MNHFITSDEEKAFALFKDSDVSAGLSIEDRQAIAWAAARAYFSTDLRTTTEAEADDNADRFRREFSGPRPIEEHMRERLAELNREADGEPDLPDPKDYTVLSNGVPQMISVDDYHIREVALSMANVSGRDMNDVVARANLFATFLRGES